MMVPIDLTPHAQAKRGRILQSAQALFVRYGFEATSMDAIAAAANVSKPTLYRYYQNKETLFVAVLEQLAQRHISESTLLALRDTSMDTLATLEHALQVWAQAVSETIMQPDYMALTRLLIAELPRFPHLRSLYAQAVPQQGSAFLKMLLESAHKHGVIVVDDLELAIRLLVGPLLTYFLCDGLLVPSDIQQDPPPERVAALVRLVLEGIASHHQKEMLP